MAEQNAQENKSALTEPEAQPKAGGHNAENTHRAVMPWMVGEEILEIDHVDLIRIEIAKSKGMLPPKHNTAALGYVTNYYSRMMERLGKYEAMQKEYFADLLLSDPDLPIGKAEAISKGSDFGMRRVFYERLCAGYLEIIQTLKKVQDHWNQEAKNQY